MSMMDEADCLLPDGLIDRTRSWIQIVKSLPFDGGPSATRWVFLRTAEIISFGWLLLVGGVVYEYVRFGKADVVYCGMILTIGGGLFAFAQQAQVAKLSIDSKATSVESNPVSSTVKNDNRS